jgi:hypothetical protein
VRSAYGSRPNPTATPIEGLRAVLEFKDALAVLAPLRFERDEIGLSAVELS